MTTSNMKQMEAASHGMGYCKSHAYTKYEVRSVTVRNGNTHTSVLQPSGLCPGLSG